MAVSDGVLRASPILTRPTFSLAASKDVLSGARLLARAFSNASECLARRGTTIVGADQSDPPLFLIHSGLAYCSTTFAGGRRAITDILLPRDIASIPNVVMARSMHTVIAATHLRYRALSANVVRDLVADNPQIAMHMLTLAGEVYHRAEQHVVALGRLEARERLSAFLLGIYDRLRGRGLISRPIFDLQLRQDEIADHLGLTAAHVSRTLRSLCEEKLASIRQQFVIIRDLDGLRAVASGCRNTR
jgi:CRP/FNR family transcriptional regulator, anaerobic regulatory protein